jgi:pyruvate carboxylase subunit B
MNLMNILKGQPRWTSIDKDTWNMILGRMGRLPCTPDPEIVSLAASKGYEFYTGNPQDEFPDALDKYRSMMDQEGWDCGQDDEELFEFAMHERQYRDYKSGVAKERFEKELAGLRVKDAVPVQAPVRGQMLWEIDVDDRSSAPAVGTLVRSGAVIGHIQTAYGMEEVVSAVDGRIVGISAGQGQNVAKGEIVAFVERL